MRSTVHCAFALQELGEAEVRQARITATHKDAQDWRGPQRTSVQGQPLGFGSWCRLPENLFGETLKSGCGGAYLNSARHLGGCKPTGTPAQRVT